MSSTAQQIRDALAEPAATLRSTSIAALFEADPGRVERFTREACGIALDLCKHKLDAAALAALVHLVEARGLTDRRRALFAGGVVNATEGRPALHTALRATAARGVEPDDADVRTFVSQTAADVARFVAEVRSGARTGAKGRPFRQLLHIGIGGSDLGPRLVYDALYRRRDPAFDVRFAANVDAADVNDAIEGLDPETTLLVIVSKSFKTTETKLNAETARAWLAETLGSRAGEHIVAVTAAPERARAFGVAADAIFPFKDWVGGRYSLWSAVSLALEIALEPGEMDALRAGAAAMDRHFIEAPAAQNLPVLLGALDVWLREAQGFAARAVIPYGRRLRLWPSFLQQLEMESNGKGVSIEGEPATASSAVVWGSVGTDAQHAFFQQLHQGPDPVPVEFVGVLDDAEGRPEHRRMLLANLFAQSEALALGKSAETAKAEMLAAGLAAPEAERLAPHRAFSGDRPSTTILLDRLDAFTLGALIALFEHKVFVASVIWGINAFDQWGVELGKVAAESILDELTTGQAAPARHAATAALIARARRHHP